MKLIPREKWVHFGHMAIYHGRSICKAPTPDCERCMLIDLCPASKIFLAAANKQKRKSVRPL
jgi:endonuclease-3